MALKTTELPQKQERESPRGQVSKRGAMSGIHVEMPGGLRFQNMLEDGKSGWWATDRQGEQKLNVLCNTASHTELSYLWSGSPKGVHISPLRRGKKAGHGEESDSWKSSWNTKPALWAPTGDLPSQGRSPMRRNWQWTHKHQTTDSDRTSSLLLSCSASIVLGHGFLWELLLLEMSSRVKEYIPMRWWVALWVSRHNQSRI